MRGIAEMTGLLSLFLLVSSGAPYTAPAGDFNQDGQVDAVDVQCLVLVFQYAAANAGAGYPCADDGACTVAPGDYCAPGFSGGLACVPACVHPDVVLSTTSAPECDDPVADDPDCLGTVNRRITDMNCDGEISNIDFSFLVAILAGKTGGADTADEDGDGMLNGCDEVCGNPAVYAGCVWQLQPGECEAEGGWIEEYRFGTKCICPTGDGGCPCTSHADCVGNCYAEIPDGGCYDVTEGQCTDIPWPKGCFCSFDIPGGTPLAMCND